MLEKAPLASCEECPLRNEPAALGTGPDQSDIVIIGEAPGVEEAKSGVPFVGASGKLLDAVLKEGGINREDVYVTNVCLCRPPDNSVPPPAAIRACHSRLVAEVKERNPKTIVLLGNTASKSVLDTRTGITEVRRQTELKSPYFQGVRIVPTFHPAATLRQGDLLPSLVSDIKRITQVQVVWEHTKWKVPETLVEGIDLLHKQAQQGDYLSLDVELDMEGDFRRVDAKNPEFLCIGISSRPGAAVVYPKHVVDHPMWRAALDNIYEHGNNKWVYQNGKFDTQFLWGAGIGNARIDEDTMLMHYVCDERKGTHDLESLAVEYLRAPKYKTDAKQYLPFKGASLANLPQGVLYEYNAGDADVTLRLLEPLRKEMIHDGVTRPYSELLIPGSNALARAEYVGAKVDREGLLDLGSKLSERLGNKRSVLNRWVANPNSPIQVKGALHDLGYDVESTNVTQLEELIKHGGEVKEFATALLEYRTDAKLLSTYVTGLGKSLVRSRVHPTFLLHGTETGRLSCRRPNLQNIPSGSIIRDAFISGPDNILLQADYSQIEFRLAAILSGDEWLLEQFRAGREFHKEVARRFYGDVWTPTQYLRAKAVNFGILYGRGAKSLSDEWEMPYKEAQRMIDTFFGQAPGLKDYHRGIEKEIRERGYLESYFGRKRRFWLVTKQNWHMVAKEGYNFPLQSTASDLTLSSLIQLEPLLRGKAAPVITVHDSIIFEVRRQYLEEVRETVQKVMEATPVSDICPTPVEIKTGERWGSLHA